MNIFLDAIRDGLTQIALAALLVGCGIVLLIASWCSLRRATKPLVFSRQVALLVLICAVAVLAQKGEAPSGDDSEGLVTPLSLVYEMADAGDCPVLATDLASGDTVASLRLPPDLDTVSDLRFFAISPEADRTLLGIAWPAGMSFPNSRLDLFVSHDLDASVPWSCPGRIDLGGALSNVVVSLDRSVSDTSAFYVVADQTDGDDDGLSDAFENLVTRTSATEADSDGDGFGDGVEVSLGIDPASADTDDDGLTDDVELGRIDVLPDDETYWQPMRNVRNLWSGTMTSDDGSYVVDLPHPFTVNGTVYTQIRVCADGLIYLLDPERPTYSYTSRLVLPPSLAQTRLSDHHIAIAGFAANLFINCGGWNSSVICGESTMPSGSATVVDFYRIGFANQRFSDDPDLFSYQLVLPSGEPNVFYLTYQQLIPATAFAARNPAIGVQCPMLTPIYADESYYNLTVQPTEQFFNAMRRVKVVIGRGTDPCSADTDGDGFTDAEEIRTFHTDPRSADDDLDGDGLPDVVELAIGSDPLLIDTDGDGLSDRGEFLLGTDPLASDTDRDGLPDGWEADHGLDPASSVGRDGADGDPDGDGLRNLGEYLNGCDPQIADTDGDGVNDGAEVAQESNPADASDDGLAPPPGCFRELVFDIDGDWAAWELTITGLGPDDTRTRRISMGAPDAEATASLRLRKGNSYRLTMRWLNCGGHEDHCAPWYCWQARIDGLPTTRTSVDYSDLRLSGNELVVGNGWIAENDDGLLTTHVHEATVSPYGGFGGGNVAGGLSATLRVLDDPKIVPDFDRDGDIDAADEEKARQPGTVFRFWVNDDEDRLATDGKYSESPRVNIPGARDGWFASIRRAPDCDSPTVNGICDLLDFAPVLADVSSVVSTLPAGIRSRLRYRLRQSGGAFKAVWSNLAKEHANAFQRTPFETGFGETFLSAPQSAPVTEIPAEGIELPPAFAALAENRGGVFLLEGYYASSNPLWLEVRLGTDVLCSNRLDICVSPVEQMYRHVSLRAAASDPQVTVGLPDAPTNQPADARDLDVFFLHGFNVDAEAARAWGAEIFKRLWQSGSNARFHMLPWRGDYSWSYGDTFNGLHYQHNVWFAQRTGEALKRYIEAAQTNSTKRILMTQSLGNMVACEALRKGLHVAQYYMFDAAVASEAIDGTLRAETSADDPYLKYVRPEWRTYPGACWAANWHRLFANDSTDARRQMGWANRFQAALGNAGAVFNYYSSGDSVFAETDNVPELLDGALHWGVNWFLWIIPYPALEVTFENHCWQKQEVLKGMATVAATLSGGWGFRVWSVYDSGLGDFRRVRYSPEGAAAALADGSIVTNPVFDYNDAEELMNPNATEDDIHLALAKHIPAISSPVGGMEVARIASNINMNNNSANQGIVRPNGWGRSHPVFGSSWLHSDMKDMAFYYVYKLYEQLVEGGQLR